MRRILPLAAAIAALGLASGTAHAQQKDPVVMKVQADPAVIKGVAYLKSKIPTLNPGEAGITALALIKSGMELNDPALAACLARFEPTFAGTTYTPATKGGPDTYEAAVVLLALVNIDPIGYKPQIDACAQFLIGKQYANGSWDYSDRTAGDTSMTQYAILALWEAENAGIIVPASLWDKAAGWYLSVQNGAGSWNYHRDQSNWPETLSMTGAGVGSLMICQKQLARHRKGQDLLNPLMIPLTIDGQAAETRYKVETPAAAITSGINKGVAWIISHFQVNKSEIMGQSPYYCLYGLERLVALGKRVDTDPDLLAAVDWYNKGKQFALSSQEAGGSWNAQHDQVPNTCWTILFMVKSTAISMKKIEIRRLNAGVLTGQEGLPPSLENVDVVNGKIVVRPMGGAIEGMLSALEDPKATDATAALAGIVAQYQKGGPKVLRPLKDRFRKMYADNKFDDSMRAVAIWGLGRTADLDVAPTLIKALLDDDAGVVREARIGLQVLSRKLDGFGPADKIDPMTLVPTKPSAEECLAAARKWQAWFQSVKPPDLDAPDEILPAAAPAAKPAPAEAGR